MYDGTAPGRSQESTRLPGIDAKRRPDISGTDRARATHQRRSRAADSAVRQSARQRVAPLPPSALIALTARREGQRIAESISDGGPGIPVEFREKSAAAVLPSGG